MKKLYTIGFLNHSGFYVELEDCILIFDYYQDPEQRVDSLLAETTKKVYFLFRICILIILIRKFLGFRIK